jgi:radical SAM superfamily enzyme YgiQ (UPF0313 family)
MGMRILLIDPGEPTAPILGPRLGLRVLAAHTSAEHQVTILEHKEVDRLRASKDWDLVGITSLTKHVNRAYFFADSFRMQGVPVIFGGVHATGLPEEAKQHADAVCIGEGDLAWPQILQDAQNRQLKPFYHSDALIDRHTLISPRRLPTDLKRYGYRFPVETGRGCPVHCAFCFVPVNFSAEFQPRAIERIVADVRAGLAMAEGDERIQFAIYENLLHYREHAERVCAALGELGIRYGVEGRLETLRDPAYLEIIRRTGCQIIYIETKMISPRHNPAGYQVYAEAVQKIKDQGLIVSINFTVGYDDHDLGIIDDALEFITRYDLRLSYVQLLVPWPGLPIFKRLDQEGRILNRNWSTYDNDHVVFQPKLTSVEELQRRYNEFWRTVEPWKQAALETLTFTHADRQR